MENEEHAKIMKVSASLVSILWKMLIVKSWEKKKVVIDHN
jgi:hypothetical protein